MNKQHFRTVSVLILKTIKNYANTTSDMYLYYLSFCFLDTWVREFVKAWVNVFLLMAVFFIILSLEIFCSLLRIHSELTLV